MASPEATRSRFIEELIGTARILEDVESAAIAEAWASGAIAEWLALDGVLDALPGRVAPESPLGALVLASMLGVQIEADIEPDVEWISDLGTHEIVNASHLMSPSGELGYVFTCRAASGAEHDLGVSILSGALTGVTVGPKGLVEGMGERPQYEMTSVAINEASKQVTDALEGTTESLSEATEANVPLLRFRLGRGVDIVAARSETVLALAERDQDEDQYGADVVRSALRHVLEQPAPPGLADAIANFETARAGGDPDALVVMEVAGVSPTTAIDRDAFVRLVGAYLAPVSLGAHPPAEQEALSTLEPADWIGVVLGISRAPVGTAIDGDAMVTMINRCPEITTTIPKRDAPLIAWSFEAMLFSWTQTGVLDENGATTALASWLLPTAAVEGWAR